MRWWITENGGRHPYPMSCLSAIAATVLCILSTLNMCVTLSLGDELPHMIGNIRDNSFRNLEHHLSSRTARSSKLHGLKHSASGIRTYAGHGKVFGDDQSSRGEWDERYGSDRHRDPRQRYSNYKDSLSRKPKKPLDGQRSSTVDQFCNRTEPHSLPRCVLCSETLHACPTDYTPRKKGLCVLRDDRRLGCSYDCIKQVVVPECCPGFWGSQCLPCPGNANNVCNLRGECEDGIHGNGECQCNQGFDGVSCELCQQDNMYGQMCNQECLCVHGVCNNGPSGDGSCTCRLGYQGQYCDQEDNVCMNLGCHQHAHCEQSPGTTDLMCVCNRGYDGDGQNCQEHRIHCGDTICHQEAFCSTGGNCVCNPDHSGDGIECYPINPCQENYGNCEQDSSFCLYDGPGQSHCECRHGYENFQPNQGCTMIDMCSSNQYNPDCPPNSDCYMEQPGVPSCQCRSGYVSINDGCYGNIMQRLEELSSTGEPGIQGEIDTTLTLLRYAGLANLLSGSQFFTVMIPTDEAYLHEDMQHIMTQAHSEMDFASYLMRLHILPTYLNSLSLNQTSDVYTLTGLKAEVTHSSKDPTILRYRVEGSNNRGALTHKDLLASNGIIHIIDTLMYEPRQIENNISATIFDVISSEGRFNRLENALRNTRLDSIIDRAGTFTFFAPYNKAFNDLPDGTVDFLFSDEGRPKLQALLKNHIVNSDSLRAQDLLNLSTNFQLTSLYNSALTIRTASNGQISLNGGVNLTITDVHTGNGIIHAVDGLILPPDIQPLLPHKCRNSTEEIIPGICDSCANKKELRCPAGSTPTDTSAVTNGCVYEAYVDGLILHEVGCSITCSRTTWTEDCCGGFYSESCLPCPGGFQTPCNSHGQCDDKMTGIGRCTCDDNFSGTACELCSSQNHYGENCDQICTCIHGVCDSGPLGSGQCQPDTCALGFFGENCDQHVTPCGPQENPCHAHAMCHQDHNEIRCICNAGYEGDGLDCWPVNVCELPTRGQCHEEAQCIYHGSGQHECECNEFWEGDGYNCIPVNPCTQEDHGGCHSNATCIYTSPGQNDCECKYGYSGNGQFCDIIDLCSRSHGGCHPEAVCEFLGPGSVRCRCERGYVGDGLTCYSNIAVELATLPNVSRFYSLIENAKLERSLAGTPAVPGVTVFIPSNEAFDDFAVDFADHLSDDHYVELLVKKHLVKKTYWEDDLIEVAEGQNSWLPNWLESALLISTCGESVCVDQSKAHVVHSDIVASNGVIHIIDKVLTVMDPDGYPDSDSYSYDDSYNPEQAANPQLPEAIAHYPNFRNFSNLLSDYGLYDILNEAEAFTLFVPGNLGVQVWDQSKLNFDLLKFHIILGQTLSTAELKDGLHVDSYLGHNYQLRFHITSLDNTQQYYVNKVPIVQSDIPAGKGVVHFLIDVINMVPNFCDTNRTSYSPSSCLECNFLPDCPMGSVPTDSPSESNCQYTEELYGRKYQRDGCQYQCMLVEYIPQCCSGFYGNDCEECPGGWVRPCNGNGICSDGYNGTGSCECQPGFVGIACEQCQRDKYGSLCQHECQCDHGLCRDGMDGDGSCRCNRGWTGQYCNISASDMGQSCGDECDPNAYCVDGICVCYAGFTGDGLACAQMDHEDICSTAQCSDFAQCQPIPHGYGRYECVCKPGYLGDGIICREENPCETGQSGCHEYAECVHTGPASSACNCLPGYDGDGRIHCQPINACASNNGGCDIRAFCRTTGPNERECECFENFVGDGFSCTGAILHELRLLPEYSSFATLVYRDPHLKSLLAMPGPFTMFVPNNDALQKIDAKQLDDWQQTGGMIQILLYHIISCQALESQMLQTIEDWNTLVGQTVSVSDTQDGVVVNGAASIINADIESTNGIIHGIDRLLTPRMTFRSPYTQTPTFEALARNGSYNIFLDLLQRSGVDAEFNNPLNTPITMFVPSDAAFNLLPAEQLAQLQGDDDLSMVQEFVQYHIVPAMMLHVADFAATPGGERFTTLQGSQIAVGCNTDKGGIYVNGVSQLIDFERHFQEGLFFGLDHVLEPPSIGGRCDEINERSTWSRCESCSFQFWCPPGTIKHGGPVQNCRYVVGWFQQEDGCWQECVSVKRIPKCCENHYGTDCRECPGGSSNPCSGHGTCSDGHDRDGQCQCEEGFTGIACELCTEGRYGLNCEECPCGKNGICEDGRHGSGACFCHQGWTGASCNTPVKPPPPVCDPPCDPQNAVCREGNRCECYPQYFGNGHVCLVINQCAFNNVGCSPYASCSQDQTNVTCTCRRDYEGDGVYCQPIDRCQNDNGGCHPGAKCTMTGPNTRSCECNPPTVGNGIQCEERQSHIPRCSIDNGGCSENAYCIEEIADPEHGPPDRDRPGRGGPGRHGPRRKRQSRLPPYRPLANRRTVRCECKQGYIGNGTLCNGDMLETLASIPAFSAFYQALIQYSQQKKADGEKLLKGLQNGFSRFTVFVPIGEEFNNKSQVTIPYATVPNYFIEMMKISQADLYDNMTLTTWKGTDLKVEYQKGTYSINGVKIVYFDIPTTNGVIHVLQKAINVKSVQEKQNSGPYHPPSRILAMIILAIVTFIIMCIIGIIVIQYRAYKKRRRGQEEPPPRMEPMVSFRLEDDKDGEVTFASKEQQDEGGEETDMTDTEDGGTASGMESPDFVIGDDRDIDILADVTDLTLDNDTIAFAEHDFIGASHV